MEFQSQASPLPPTLTRHATAPMNPTTSRPPSRSASITHSRSTSRAAPTMPLSASNIRSQSPRAVIHTHAPSTGPERKPSISQHNRQTSIVNGGITHSHHSRNSSFVNSPTTSPLSPQIMNGLRHATQEGNGSGVITIPSFLPSPPLPIDMGQPGMGPMSINGVVNGDTTRSIAGGLGGTRHGHSKSRSHNKSQSHTSSEPKTPAEYALHILFTQFVRLAEAKINICISHPLDSEPNIESICGAGVDPAFDKLIGSLGYIARHKPRPVIDSAMFWRKSKSDSANAARSELKQQVAVAGSRQAGRETPVYGRHQEAFSSLMRRNTEPTQQREEYGSYSTSQMPSNASSASLPREASAIADRRSTIAIYILCRVLIEVIGQTTLEAITEEMADKLEDIIFNQLRSADSDILASSPLRMGNWTLFAQLLGVMSDIHFESVSDRLFLSDLEKTGKGFVSKELEPRVELVIRGMSYLKLKLYPPDAFEEGCEFMILLTKLFLSAQGHRIKHAYCDLYMKLLLPVAAHGETELNMPRWVEFVQMLYPQLIEMCTKQKHWDIAFPLLGTLLCTTPWELFTSNWLPLLEVNATKLKDRTLRVMIVQVAARLIWTYLFRCVETLNVTIKKLEVVVRLLFPNGKRSLLAGGDPDLMEAFVQLIRFIGFKHQDFCFRNIISPLLNADALTSSNTTSVDLLSPERMIVGIRSFLLIMSDLEKQDQKPPYPIKFESSQTEKETPISTWLIKFVSEKKEAMKKLDRMSRPVQLDRLGSTAKEYFERFGDILGRITWVCDTNFGGKALLDERFNHTAPKTPVTATFSFNLDHPTLDQKQSYYDLLNTAFSALPRCLPPNIPITKLVEILCHGTAHVDYTVATGAANALKCIARQSIQRQKVIIGFARFIFDFDGRYATTSDAGMLGSAHIENTLKLYVELLQIWIEAIKQKTKTTLPGFDGAPLEEVPTRMDDLEVSNVKTVVDEIESHGLFFLSSCSRIVRRFAIMVLRLITEFDDALNEHSDDTDVEDEFGAKTPKKTQRDSQQFTRIIHILESDSLNVMNQNVNDDKWSVADRSRLRRELFENKSQDALMEMATSENQYDSSLWFKLFPKLIRICFEKFPLTVVQCRDTVCARLSQMQNQMLAAAETVKTQNGPFENIMKNQQGKQQSLTSPEGIINQWKIYLIVACSTLTLSNQDPTTAVPNSQHLRKVSKTAQPSSSTDRIISGRSMFQMVIPFLASENQSIRDAVVTGLGSININLYKTLLETFQPYILRWSDGSPNRAQRPPTSSGPRRSRRQDRLRTEVTHVMQLTSYFLQQSEIYQDLWIVQHLVAYIKDMKTFLSEPEIKQDLEYLKLRRYFCGLMEELFEGLNRTSNPERWLPFDGRRSLFNLIEQWCGQSSHWATNTTASIEIEKNDLKTAALSAMASLCAGPVSTVIGNRSTVTFDIAALFHWTELIFNESSDRLHRVGRKALGNLLLHNRDTPQLLALAMKQCYLYRTSQKGIESYFTAVSDVLINDETYPCGLYQALALALFKIGDENHRVRSKAATLLRVTEERYFQTTTVLDYEVSIADKTAAVYKRAQFELSKSMSNQHHGEAFLIFSEFTMFFNLVDSKSQRDLLAVLLPWVQMIELGQDPNGGPSPMSYMVLANLFEITVKFSGKIHNEVEGLWMALASAPFTGNVKVVLDFIIAQSLERKEQNFVNMGKQIIVCLAGTANGAKLVEALIAYLQPKLMSIHTQEPYVVPEKSQFPYMAILSETLPLGGKQHGFSRGHLGLILMVDLLVGPVPEMAPNLPLLLQVVFVLWDHYVPLVQEQAREMLVHLIHELIISKMNNDSAPDRRLATREFVESVRAKKPKTHWTYDDNGTQEDAARIPVSMGQMVNEVLEIFSADFPMLKEQWGRIALQWATNCPVRHLACRSFQVFRCLLTTLDQSMLADMLARLSNTIADNSSDIQSFAMEILITLNSITAELNGEQLLQYPQLFWATVACLHTIHEREFMEVLSLLEKIIDKLDLAIPENVDFLLSMYPATWEGKFEGLQALIVKGLRSSVSIKRTLQVMDKLSCIPSNDLIGGSNRLLFATLANLPRFLNAAEKDHISNEITICAERLRDLAESEGQNDIRRIMDLYATARFRSKDSFRSQAVGAVRETFFPAWEAQALIFLVGMLSNNLKWFKLKVMELLTAILPLIDMRKPEFAGVGADLISPLLRLLQTEYCQQALEVLDKVITISGSKMDRQVMRMSLGNRTLRKEYERTETLFGIPEDSGWAIPMPAIMASTTRANVHAVFYTCQIHAPEDPTIQEEYASDLQFQMEDYSYTSFQERTATMLSEDARGDEVFGNMMVRLENLDSFFADGAQSAPGQPQEETSDESAPQLYDSRVYAILNHSLHRSPSVTSFKNTFSDSLAIHGQPLMTPTIFTAPPLVANNNNNYNQRYGPGPAPMPNRGQMNNNNNNNNLNIGRPASESSSDDEYEDQDDMSDDDDDDDDDEGSAGYNDAHTPKDDSPFLLESLLKSAGQKAKSGMEGVRNLRRGREKEREEREAGMGMGSARSPVTAQGRSPATGVRSPITTGTGKSPKLTPKDPNLVPKPGWE